MMTNDAVLTVGEEQRTDRATGPSLQEQESTSAYHALLTLAQF